MGPANADALVVGTNGPDTLGPPATNGSNVIAARDGGDQVVARDGFDLIALGAGRDKLRAGRDTKLIIDDDGNRDRITFTDGADSGTQFVFMANGTADFIECTPGTSVVVDPEDRGTGPCALIVVGDANDVETSFGVLDFRFGTNSDDTFVGTDESEAFFGKGGDDSVDAGGGDDLLFGGPGRNVLEGGPGSDFLVSDNRSLDVLRGGAGDDRLIAMDGYKDIIKCGEGDDTVYADAGIDVVDASCEHITAA